VRIYNIIVDLRTPDDAGQYTANKKSVQGRWSSSPIGQLFYIIYITYLFSFLRALLEIFLGRGAKRYSRLLCGEQL